MDPVITRHRHEVKRRTLTVLSATRITPNMLRIVFGGEDLADFTSLSPDDHVKLIVPGAGDQPEMRDYTPRAFDAAARRLTIDFALHEAGAATQWALAAKPGDRLQIGGPRGSAVVTAAFDWWLLIGDETALPALGRRIEELPAGTRVTSLGLVTAAEEEQRFDTAAELTALWLHRPAAAVADPAPVIAALERLQLPEGRGFIWIAAEAGVARAARDHFLTRRNHPRGWLKAAGYWVKGVADGHDKMLD
ncbi:MAG: siderophore-interacting protein [Rhodobacteraceae bacterium]|nr:siderophore-interacting protein [Paracoccaceae bacterium]